MITKNLNFPSHGGSDAVISECLADHKYRTSHMSFCRLRVTGTIHGAIEAIENTIGKSVAFRSNAYDRVVSEINNPGPILMSLYIDRYATKPFEDIPRNVSVTLYGTSADLQAAYMRLTQKFPPIKSQTLQWSFMKADGNIGSATMELPESEPVKDEAYPWIKQGVDAYQREYLDSTANIMLLIGDPGCGKTTFIRDMIRRNDLSCVITHDERLVANDAFFIEFLTGGADMLIVEDADVLLSARERGNTLMSKLLNASDGLISTKKKIVLTANLTHADQIDSALMRPGRCFSTNIFRSLSAEEAKIAADAYGVADPGKGVPLCRLFAKEAEQPAARVGFAA